MKKARIYSLEKKLTTLKKIKCPSKVKKELRKEAKNWIKWINQHIEDLHNDKMSSKSHHQGGIDILEIFFNVKSPALKHEACFGS